MVVDLKTAIVKPLLKKSSLDKHLLKNHRPISNLPFLSKILEKVVLHKLLFLLQKTTSATPFSQRIEQDTAQRPFCYVCKWYSLRCGQWHFCSFLLLLQLSSAFDTIDHKILLSRLNSVFGIQSTALQWFQSYLSDRYQSTSVDNLSSSPSRLKYGVSWLSTWARSLRPVHYTSLRYHS